MSNVIEPGLYIRIHDDRIDVEHYFGMVVKSFPLTYEALKDANSFCMAYNGGYKGIRASG